MDKLLAMFFSVFLAELGDKTQLATLLFAASGEAKPLAVFVASAGALVCSSVLAVVAGSLLANHIAGLPLKLIAGVGFVGLGLWTIWGHFTGQ